MATLERPQDPKSASTASLGSGDGGADVLLRVRPHLISLPARGMLEKPKGPLPLLGGAPPPSGGGAVPLAVVKVVDASLKALGKPFAPAVKEYCTQLVMARDRCLTLIGEDTSDAEQINDSVTSYLSILQGLVPKSVTSPDALTAPAVESMPAVDETAAPVSAGSVEPAGIPSSSGSVSEMSAAARLLNSVLEFQWWDLFAEEGRKEPAKGGAAFEMASTLLSTALWKARRAARICNSPTKSDGVNAAESSDAYRLLREAAGLIQLLRRDSSLTEAAALAGASDLKPSVLRGLETLWLAEAQTLTVLRALAKESSSKLVAAVARDTFEQYETVPHRLDRGLKWSSNIAAYCAFKVAAFQAHAHIAHAQSRMDVEDAAQALRSSQEASQCAERAKASADTFDKTEVRRDPAEHEGFRTHLRSKVNHATDRITKLNSLVHYKAPAQDLPELPAATNLATSIPFDLPPTAPTVQLLNDEAEAAGTGEGGSQPATGQGSAGLEGAAQSAPAEAQQPNKKSHSCCCFTL